MAKEIEKEAVSYLNIVSGLSKSDCPLISFPDSGTGMKFDD
ncbi:MAG: hypothetical protein ACOC4M_15990 [Promethearchaeia archaeon]